MKSLLTAMALATLASPCFALPMNTQSARDLQATNATVQDEVTTVQLRRRPRTFGVNPQAPTRDPDPFVQNYLRADPPGSQWNGE